MFVCAIVQYLLVCILGEPENSSCAEILGSEVKYSLA